MLTFLRGIQQTVLTSSTLFDIGSSLLSCLKEVISMACSSLMSLEDTMCTEGQRTWIRQSNPALNFQSVSVSNQITILNGYCCHHFETAANYHARRAISRYSRDGSSDAKSGFWRYHFDKLRAPVLSCPKNEHHRPLDWRSVCLTGLTTSEFALN